MPLIRGKDDVFERFSSEGRWKKAFRGEVEGTMRSGGSECDASGWLMISVELDGVREDRELEIWESGILGVGNAIGSLTISQDFR